MDSALVRNRYQKKNIIGEGGVAVVYEGYDSYSNDKIAIKISHPEPACIDAILHEYSFLTSHRHPAIIPVDRLLWSKSENGEHEIAQIIMPLLTGLSLENPRKRLQFAAKVDAAFDEIAARLLEAAAFIHFCGFLYNDFKPANLICDFSRSDSINLTLIDFNLITPINSTTSKRGTLEYTAPEILQGELPAITSDIYSLGATLYELLAGEPPHQSSAGEDLIKQISEHGIIDYEIIPARYRDGLGKMLSRDLSSRPSDVRQAAKLLGLYEPFQRLLDENSGCYLRCGKPPFWKELLGRFSEYKNHKSEKIFALKGYADYCAALNYLSAEFEASGYLVERIRKGFQHDCVNKSLEFVVRLHDAQPDHKLLVLIDDLNFLKPEQLQILRSLVRNPRLLPVAGGISNGVESTIPVEVFNPFKDQTKTGATAEVLQALLKQDSHSFDFQSLSSATGGDPLLVETHFMESIRKGEFDLLGKQGELKLDSAAQSCEIIQYLDYLTTGLDFSGHQTISLLSCWGESIPMILLAELKDNQGFDIEKFLAKGILIKNRDSIEFSSDDLRIYIYDKIESGSKSNYHLVWAELAEKYVENEDELIEKTAVHWGESENLEKGFRANLRAATHFLQKSELSRAYSFSNKSIELAQAKSGSLAKALMIQADIAKQMGNYPAARKSYLQLLRQSSLADDSLLEAETYKDLGDLYRSMKKPRKALYYIEKAQGIFEKLGIRQEVANCHNNKGLVFWVGEKFQLALESFDAALELNSQLHNFKELSKIYSNIGIIRDIIGDTSKVSENFETALSNARLADDTWLEALISNNLGYFHLRQNNLEKSRNYLQEALAISKKIGYKEQEINSLSNLGLCLMRQGDLIQAVECNQQALQMAETIANPYLMADSNLHLSEVCIEMGNFNLADQALKRVEKTDIYSENKSLRIQTMLLRAQWHNDIGDYQKAMKIAFDTALLSDSIENPGTRLEAEVIRAKAMQGAGNDPGIDNLAQHVNQAQQLGNHDLVCQIGLLIAESYLSAGDYFNCEGWLLKIQESSLISFKIKLETRIKLLSLLIARAKYNEALGELIEIESGTASSGFLQIALNACLMQADIYNRCGKIPKGKETISRFHMYSQNIMSTLPDHDSLDHFLNSAIMERSKIVENQIRDKEICSV